MNNLINKRKVNISFSVLLLSFVLCFFSSCELETVGEEDITETSVSETVFEPQPFPVTIAGVEIEKSPEKVVCLSPSITEIIYELGFGQKLTGRGSYCDYPPVVVDLKDIGSSANPDIDKILSVSPDIVLTQTPIADKDLFIMEHAGIKTIILPSPKTLNGFKKIYQALGLIFNGTFSGMEKGEEAFSAISKTFDNLGVVYIGNFVYVTENFGLATGDTLENAVLSCFGKNIAESGTEYGFDKSILIENQPDVILLSNKYTLEDLLSDEILSVLDAVRNGKVIFIDNKYFERPTKRIIEMIDNFISDYKKLQ